MNRSFHTAVRRGLTLIELVVVVAILAVLAAVVIPRSISSNARLSMPPQRRTRRSNDIVASAQDDGRIVSDA